LHELVEYFLVRKRGIKIKDIDKFDIEYEKARSENKKFAPCGCKIKEGPGKDIHAPYYREHQFATKVEKMFIKKLGYSWKEYNKEIDKLFGE
jgi:translation initiation factor 1 (eIF-1/SUI1)